jgi:predicted O-linked N-acetylglucosamine transferase (SPINDLY family)
MMLTSGVMEGFALDMLQRELSAALAYHQRGELVRAQELYRGLLQRFPDSFDALHLLGVATVDLGAAGTGIEFIRRAIALDPTQANARCSLAQALLASGDRAAALAALDDATAVQPEFADAWFLRGNVLQQLDKFAEAVDSYERAIAIRTTYPEAFNNLAAALRALKRTGQALECAERALSQRPNYAMAFNNRGLILLAAGRGAAAVESFRQTLTAEPRFAEALHNMGTALMQLHRFTDARNAFAQLVDMAPGFRHAPGNLLHAGMSSCDWQDYRRAAAITQAVERGEHADAPLSFLAISDSPAAQRLCAHIYSEAFFPRLSQRLCGAGHVHGGARLRIGYLSSDFRDHPVGQLCAGVFESHDRSRFETYGLCAAPDDGSELRRRLVRAFDHFEEVGSLPDAALAARIAALQLDALIDLGGHTFGSRTRVLAYRPAPLQIAFLGFPGTLGTDFIDYLIVDRHVIPESERPHYAEQLIYLPDSYLPGDLAPSLPSAPGKTAAGLPEEAFVFCSFNAPYKLTPPVFDSWMRVLHAAPNAILWLREGSPAMQGNLAREAASRGVDPARLVHAPRVVGVQEHQARFALADLFLDTTPYNAHTTASEALAAAVPVITQPGRSFASRVATSLLHAVGLGHLSVADAPRYERLAIDLARSPADLAALKAHLRRVRSSAPLFDAQRFCRHLEDAFTEVIGRQRRSLPPLTLAVQARERSGPMNFS